MDSDRRATLFTLGSFIAGAACSASAPASAGRRSTSQSPRPGSSNDEHSAVVAPAMEIGLAPPGIDAYAALHGPAESEAMLAIAAETKAMTKWWIMMIGPVEAGLLRMLVAIRSARRVLEVGTFTGYSAMAMAEAMPNDGRIITCDVSKEWTNVARRHWDSSPHGKKIELALGDANETIASLDGPFDLVFIDANKDGYIDYWDATVPKLSPGGLIVADNVLARGQVLDPVANTHAAAFNEHVRADARMESVLLPIRDGVTVARLRS
jgi:caffeoyl-CoA O-methyltransferase